MVTVVPVRTTVAATIRRPTAGTTKARRILTIRVGTTGTQELTTATADTSESVSQSEESTDPNSPKDLLKSCSVPRSMKWTYTPRCARDISTR